MRQIISLSQNRTLIAAYSRSPHRTRDWVVYLPQSGAEFHTGSRAELARLIGKKASVGFHFLSINKPGVGPRKVDRPAFERSFRRDYRVRDAVQAMREIIPAGHRIFLIGFSEGAYLAPEIARRDARVKRLALIGGGTRGWLKEELANAKPHQRSRLRRQIRAIEKSPVPDKKWCDFSYATWFSYREDRTLAALKGLRQPTLAILGGRDRTIDLKSTLTDLRRLADEQSIHIEVFPRCGHTFDGHWSPVSRLLTQHLSRQD